MKEQLKKGQKAAGIATIATIGLSLIKAVIGVLAGSFLLIADAIHSAVDIIAIFASWFGLKISQREPNQKFPYGYYKAENLATLIIVGFIFYASYEILLHSYEKLFFISELDLPIIAIVVPLFSAIISYFIAIYENKVGKEINSQSLIANAQESKIDVLSSLMVFVGMLLSYFNIKYVEGIIGIALGLLILKVGYDNAKLAIFSLMDASPNPLVEEEIKKVILQTKGAKDVNHLKLRQSGTLLFGEANLKVSKNLDVESAHDISDAIEESIKQKYPKIESFILHIEPHHNASQKIAIPIIDKNSLDSEVMGHFGRTKNWLIASIEDNNIKSWYIKENPFLHKKIRAGLEAAKFLIKENIDVLIIQKIGEISYYTLKDNQITILLCNGATVKQVLDNFISKNLKKLKAPTHTADK